MTTSGIGLYGDTPLAPVPHVKREVLEEWRRRVRSESNERGVVRTEPALSRFVSEFIERLFRADAGERESGSMLVPTARFTEGCTVSEAVHELSLLRSAIVRVFARTGVRMPMATAEYVNREIDEAIADIVSDIHRGACARLEASHRVEHALRENEDRMRLALVAAEVGTWEFRPLTGELTWDDRCKEIWGLPAGREPSYELFVEGIHPEDRARVEAIVEQTLQPRGGGSYKIEYRATGLSDGPERWVSCEGKCFFDPDGRPVRFIGTVLDITERRREVEFRERFVGMLGHDLRQPLSVVNYASETLLKQGLPNDSTELVRRVVRSGDRMNRMIRDLLDFARGRQGGGIPIARKSLDLHELMRHLVDEIGTVNPSRTIELAVDGDGSGHWDPDRMAQVFQNLLCNAVTYGAPGTPIYVVMVEEGRYLETSITNYGPPIPKGELGQLFSPYRRGRRARGAERLPRGLGLGLYIAQEIVHAHGGSIDAASDSDSGTTFTVLLPRG